MIRHPGLFDSIIELGDFACFAFLIAQFLLNRLHLLTEIILLLRSFHAFFDALPNLLLKIQDLFFIVDNLYDLIQPFFDIDHF
ncbi:Uncharacterised protein [Mycobacteroides abscessus subsp. abscessus]|nr:Uncharacterised protein [Mycobacteroides abscessus subsp. abscessus]